MYTNYDYHAYFLDYFPRVLIQTVLTCRWGEQTRVCLSNFSLRNAHDTFVYGTNTRYVQYSA